jgi:two-component system nitrogen regulation sensor histidine kinase GlnL
MERIFFPMVTSKAEGTGLGLPIAQDIINRHGGLIACRSEPGHTIFSIYLPVENGHEQ